jgi:hypothetical protein
VLRRLTVLVLGLTLLAVEPVAAGVTGTVEPATDLVDGQIVRVVVDGLPAQPGGTWVEIVQCRAPVTDRATDCVSFGPYRHVNPDGLLRTRVRVRSRLLLDGGSHDCRDDTCVFRVAVDVDPLVTIPLDLDPAGPIPDPPAVTVTPTTDLVDGDRVVLHGTGFAEYDNAVVGFCAGDRCRRVARDAFTDETGTFSAQVSAWTMLPGPTDCRTAACVLRVDATYGIDAPIEVPLTYDPAGPLLSPAVTVAPHTDLGPRQSVTVRLTDFHDVADGIAVHQCLGSPSTPMDLRRCDRDRSEVVDPQDGTVRVGLRRVLHTARGEVDCSVRRCRIWVGRTPEAPSLAGPVLEFRPRR